MARVRVKICGITRLEDGLAAAKLGADALGFVFWPQSPRYITPKDAAQIIRRLPPFVTSVGLLVNPSDDDVANAIASGCDLLQFHGDETPQRCEGVTHPWIKAIRVAPGLDLRAETAGFAKGRGILLDAHVPGIPGGTGERFDWATVPRDLARQIVLAGGLTPQNVGEAIRVVRPYAVDVSGGVEISKGVKDHARIAAFIEEVRRVSEEY